MTLPRVILPGRKSKGLRRKDTMRCSDEAALGNSLSTETAREGSIGPVQAKTTKGVNAPCKKRQPRTPTPHTGKSSQERSALCSQIATARERKEFHAMPEQERQAIPRGTGAGALTPHAATACKPDSSMSQARIEPRGDSSMLQARIEPQGDSSSHRVGMAKNAAR